MELLLEPSIKNSLESEIRLLNETLTKMAESSDGFLGDLLSYTLNNAGKRVRPSLVFLTSQLGDSTPNRVLNLALGIELIHIATLVHDDVVDKAALRRGRKTVAEAEGVDTAVLLGDFVFTQGIERLLDVNNSDILQILVKSTSGMCKGEIDQLKNRFHFNISEKDYFDFIERKTASLFGASARSGAVLADQDEAVQMAVESFGVHLGMAFQITDDVLDLTGTEKVVGKTLRTDLNNGKMTLPLIHFRDQFPSLKDKAQFLDSLKNPNGHISELISKMESSGSIRYAEDVADLASLETRIKTEKIPRFIKRYTTV